MEPLEAKKIASRVIMKNLTICLLIGIIVFCFIETRFDANELLFFIDAQSNVFTVITLVMLYLGAYLFGRIAGHTILIKKKSPALTAAFYGGITYVMTIYVVHMARFYSNVGSIFKSTLEGERPEFPLVDGDIFSLYEIDAPTKVLIGLFLVVAASWLTSAWHLKNKYLTPAQ